MYWDSSPVWREITRTLRECQVVIRWTDWVTPRNWAMWEYNLKWTVQCMETKLMTRHVLPWGISGTLGSYRRESRVEWCLSSECGLFFACTIWAFCNKTRGFCGMRCKALLTSTMNFFPALSIDFASTGWRTEAHLLMSPRERSSLLCRPILPFLFPYFNAPFLPRTPT